MVLACVLVLSWLVICWSLVEEAVSLLLCLFKELRVFEHVAEKCHCVLLLTLLVDLLRRELEVERELLAEMWLLVDVDLELVSFVLELVELVTEL